MTTIFTINGGPPIKPTWDPVTQNCVVDLVFDIDDVDVSAGVGAPSAPPQDPANSAKYYDFTDPAAIVCYAWDPATQTWLPLPGQICCVTAWDSSGADTEPPTTPADPTQPNVAYDQDGNITHTWDIASGAWVEVPSCCPEAPIEIPATVDPTDEAAVNAWIAANGNGVIGQLYYFVGDGTANDPDYAWEDNGDGTGTNLESPDCCPEPPVEIPPAAFADPASPTDAEINAWIAANGTGVVDQLYYIVGGGTADNPDFVYSDDGDGTGTNLESPGCCPDNYVNAPSGDAAAPAGTSSVELAMADGTTQPFCEGATGALYDDTPCPYPANPTGKLAQSYAGRDGKNEVWQRAPEHYSACIAGVSAPGPVYWDPAAPGRCCATFARVSNGAD